MYVDCYNFFLFCKISTLKMVLRVRHEGLRNNTFIFKIQIKYKWMINLLLHPDSHTVHSQVRHLFGRCEIVTSMAFVKEITNKICLVINQMAFKIVYWSPTRIGAGGELLWIRYWTSGFHKLLGNYRVSKQLGISQVVLSSMELVS
jgi:hypothetical protein